MCGNGFCGNNSLIWIVLILIILCGCGGLCGGNVCSGGCDPTPCGC